MANPHHHGSSGLPESESPSSSSGFLPNRYSYASAAAGGQGHTTASASHLPGPARGSIISQLLNSEELGATQFGLHGRPDANHNGTGADSWASTSIQLPAFSKAFQAYAHNSDWGAGAGARDGPGFFVPSYLEGSTYVQKLQDAYRSKQKEGLAPPNPAAPSLGPNSSSASLQTKPASHRGISHHVVEKPPLEDEEALAPLPSRWSKDDKYAGLEILGNGLEVKCNGVRGASERDHEAYSLRADHYMPPQCGIFYFEVMILGGKRDEYVPSMGLTVHDS